MIHKFKSLISYSTISVLLYSLNRIMNHNLSTKYLLKWVNIIIKTSHHHLIITEKISFACAKQKAYRHCSFKRPPKNKTILKTINSFPRQSQQLQINEDLETNYAEQWKLYGMLSCGASIDILCSNNAVINRISLKMGCFSQ